MIAVELTEHQAGYLAMLVRYDLRKKQKMRERVTPRPDQPPQEFAEFLAKLDATIEFRQRVLDRVEAS